MLAHDRFGEGPRIVLVLHGFLGSRRNLASLARALVDHDAALSVVTLDLTGHGESPALPDDADLATLGRDVLDTATALAVPFPLCVVGHSLGGRVALRAAALEPQAVGSVTLLDIAPGAASSSSSTGDIDRVLDALHRAPAEAASREAVATPLREAGLERATIDWLLMNLERDDHRYRWRVDREKLAALHRRIVAEDLWGVVEGRHAGRVHEIRGGRSSYVTEADVRRFEACGSSVDTIPEASHWLHVERPRETAKLITLFITREGGRHAVRNAPARGAP